MIKLIDDTYQLEPMLRRSGRRCVKCGTMVCSYKDPQLSKVFCYAHDNLQPWTYRSIMGRVKTWDSNRAIGTRTGKGRGWHGPHILKKDRVNMDASMAESLDNWITGHYGEDELNDNSDEPDDFSEKRCEDD